MQGKMIVMLIAFISFLVSCNEEVLDQRSGSPAQDDSLISEGARAKVGNPRAKSGKEKNGDGDSVRVITDAGFSLSLVSANQLGRRIDECIGSSHRIIKESQIIGPPSEADDGSAFLLDTVYSPGEDVVEKLKPLLDGDEALQRAGVRPSVPSIRYFSNLQEIARIVADSCERTIRDSNDEEAIAMCSCGTKAQAKAMFDRCLNAFPTSEEDVDDVLIDFVLQCDRSKKSAIASMIASFAFTVQH